MPIIIGVVRRNVSGMAKSSRTRALTLAAVVVLALGARRHFGARWYVNERPLPMSATTTVEFRVKPGASRARRRAGGT